MYRVNERRIWGSMERATVAVFKVSESRIVIKSVPIHHFVPNIFALRKMRSPSQELLPPLLVRVSLTSVERPSDVFIYPSAGKLYCNHQQRKIGEFWNKPYFYCIKFYQQLHRVIRPARDNYQFYRVIAFWPPPEPGETCFKMVYFFRLPLSFLFVREEIITLY